ncbi:MAG: lipoyl(octanoyl) transferase LipB [Candidatus Acetothermia bacterium]|nr:lipoyl(octanoyl) transferase LipB [Candidatus Bipolaricaulota bacterium]
MRTYETIDCGITDYGDSLERQKEFFQERKDDLSGDRLLITRHRPTITLGKSSDRKDILASRSFLEEHGVTLHEIGRGGGVTYHGPGQLVLYPIFDLRSYGKDLRGFIARLGDSMVETTEFFGVEAEFRTGDHVGAWLRGKNVKLGSIGIQVRNWYTMHGLALNVDLDPKKSSSIRPCGLPGVKYGSLCDYVDAPMQVVTEVLLEKFEDNMTKLREGR